MKKILVIIVMILAVASSALGQMKTKRVETNVVYGMYSGLALLMDIYFPEKPNGHGIIFIPGSGWHARLSYDARPLKNAVSDRLDPFQRMLAQELINAGYTVFVINHRAAPRFRYPAAVEDSQRAVRFIRYNANRFGINSDRIGGVGYSSGGHLVRL